MIGSQLAMDIEHKHAEIHAQFSLLNDPAHCTRGGEDCRSCPAAQRIPCRGDFDRICANLLNLILHHFQMEESAMRQLDSANHGLKAFFEPHKEEHANLMEQLSRTISEDALPADGRRAIHRLIRRWLDIHFIEHDKLLIAALDSRSL
jgi:hemerythrin